MHQKRIDFYQRIMKRGIEQIFNQLLKTSAFDPDRAKVKVEFINQVEVPQEAKSPTEQSPQVKEIPKDPKVPVEGQQ
jgi:hypothetical protein